MFAGRSKVRPDWARRLPSGCGADGITVVDVPAKLARRVRLLSTGHGRKSDPADALSVGIAAWSATALRTVKIDQAIAALRALTEHRDDLVRARTQFDQPSARAVGEACPHRGCPRTDRRVCRRGAARSPATRHPGAHVACARGRPRRRTAPARSPHRRHHPGAQRQRQASSTTLTALLGIGDVVAAKILARTGSITRFASPAAFASFCGVAPIEVSSGEVVRHRLSRAGDRQLNYALHVMALAQIRYDGPGRSYYQRKRAAGKSHKEAMRCLKRRLADVVYRTMINDSVSSLTAAA